MAVSKENTKRGSKFLSQKNFLKIFLPYFIFLNFCFTQNPLPDKILNSPSSLPILFAQLFTPYPLSQPSIPLSDGREVCWSLPNKKRR